MTAAREAIEVGGTIVGPGRRRDVEIPVSAIWTGTWISLPVAVLHGAHPGPSLWLSAAVHGDEINGVEIIRRLLTVLRPRELAGTVIATPIVNVYGFLSRSRYLPDRRDLNRTFPGSPRGSLASRLADLFMREIVAKCEFGIDMHCASDHRTNLPQIRCDLDDAETRRLAGAFGAPVTIHSKPPAGSLRAAGPRADARVLLYEAGEADRFDEFAIDPGVTGVLRVMDELGMRPRERPMQRSEPRESRETRWVRARRDGILRLQAGLGEEVVARQVLGFISDPFGRANLPVRASIDGLVIGHAQHPLVRRGDAVVHLAALSERGGTAP